jgi:hypothetical protein
MNIHTAILKLNPSVVTVSGDIAYDVNNNIVEYDLAAAEAEWLASADERVAADVRAKRNNLISDTDLWGLADYPATTEQTAYRQALRDITAQAGFPTDITWPTKPE